MATRRRDSPCAQRTRQPRAVPPAERADLAAPARGDRYLHAAPPRCARSVPPASYPRLRRNPAPDPHYMRLGHLVRPHVPGPGPLAAESLTASRSRPAPRRAASLEPAVHTVVSPLQAAPHADLVALALQAAPLADLVARSFQAAPLADLVARAVQHLATYLACAVSAATRRSRDRGCETKTTVPGGASQPAERWSRWLFSTITPATGRTRGAPWRFAARAHARAYRAGRSRPKGSGSRRRAS